ncbi:MAG: ACT domain-containing protein [candidate division Zixibacteria bacterium]|nr:ACT domain-containing protein [candidate division Zixibacteria bacterium]
MEKTMKNPVIMTDQHICKVTIHSVPDRPGIAAEVFGRLGEEGLNVSMMTASGGASGRTDISFTVGDEDTSKTLNLLDSVRGELEAEKITKRDDVVSVSLVADQMHRIPGVAGRIFRTLSSEGINIDMISASATAVTCVIDSRLLDKAVNALRQEFSAELTQA